ncbi:MAG TPA: PRC-barrel domain-containing protein [Prolixibacteraceae bacterium]
MLIKAKSLKDYKLDSKDGEIGKVKEFYFDDKYWAIRYLVADTGNWFTGNQVLISPYALVSVNKEEEQIGINLSKKQVEDSPSLSSDKPVSQQFEAAYFGYYGYPIYWNGIGMWGAYPYIMRDSKEWQSTNKKEKSWDPHLRSTNVLSGYHIQANDGEIGHVADFVIDDETWAIRYLIIDTTNWFGGKKVLISPKWIDQISWNDSKVFVNLSSEEIKQSPEYTEESLLTRDYETKLHRHYNRQGYWFDDQAIKK